jgi:excisionase family DNA binding protein
VTIDHELRELIREAAKLAIRDEGPAILREQLKQLVDRRADPPADSDQRLSTNGAARYAGVSTATIREWASSGRLRSQRAGRVLRFRKSDLDAFLSRAEPRGEGVIDLSERAREILSQSKRSRE